MREDVDEKRQRVLYAARECFVLYGLKRTSMDDIAQRAGVSRAALYLLFPNKEAIFRTGMQELHDMALGSIRAALAQTARLDERLVAAFEAKHLPLLEMVLGSPHGGELVDLHHGIGADIAQKAETAFQDALAAAIDDAEKQGEISVSHAGLDAAACARLMRLAVNGLKQDKASVAAYRRDLKHLIGMFYDALGGERHTEKRT